MVKIHPIIPLTGVGESPTMPKHNLTARKKTRHFKVGDTGDFYIMKMHGGRYGVMTATFVGPSQYEVFESERELNETFNEQLSI